MRGIRQDPWANAHRIPVEEAKPAQERGHYLHPELYGASAEKGIRAVRYSEPKQPAHPQYPELKRPAKKRAARK